MSNCSNYQNNYWYPLIADDQHGEYCRGCGISKESNWKNKTFTGLVLDKINNNGNHTIKDNQVRDFQLLCKSCNNIKNPVSRPIVREMTQSEAKNLQVEKAWLEWVYLETRKGNILTLKFVINEGSCRFDCSPETIERRYYKKYLSPESISSPIALDVDDRERTVIVLRKRESPKIALDIETLTPSPLIPEEN